MTDTARDQAIAQANSLTAMVSALECDFDRLEELRQERDDWNEDHPATPWVSEHADDAEELATLEAIAGDCADADEARQQILDDALSVEVRSDWASVGELSTIPDEFRIVLCTGGPHVELVGELNEHCEPTRVRVLYRGWNESGELFDFDHEAALTYCRQFYFGE